MRALVVLPLCLSFGSIGCSGDDGPSDIVDCEVETRDEDFFVGLNKTGRDGLLAFTLTEVEPPVRFGNRWVVQVNQAAGSAAPVDGADLIITSYMPDHGHVAPIDPEITPMATAGQYELDPIYISMPGYWEITVEAESASGNDRAMFKICVPT